MYDHLVSLSSPSSVEDKRCTAMHAASWSNHQRAATNRQLADTLTKDAADPVDLLRSCMRSGNINCLPNTSFSSERHSDPSDKRSLNLRQFRVSHPSHQMLSWFNKGSEKNVLSSQHGLCHGRFFHFWAVNCK